MLFEFFAWWYGLGWIFTWRESLGWVKNVQHTFSADVLLRTLFSPWKRIISQPGRSFDEKFKGLIDNLVSRVIGFFVRLFTLIIAFLAMLLAGLAGLALAVAWPLVPVAIIYLLVRSFSG